jgi:tetratricopeptide (TPR) repeat protein
LVYLYAGDWPEAARGLKRAWKCYQELVFDRGTADVSISLSRLHRRREEASQARDYAEEALRLARKDAYKRGIVLAHEELGDLALETDDPEKARYYYEKALTDARSIAPEGDLVYEIAWRLARVYLAQSRRDDAESLAAQAVRLATKSSDRRELGHGLATMALIRTDQQDFQEARNFVERAIDEFRGIQTPFELAQTHEIAADILGSDPQATGIEILGHLFEACRLYGKLGAVQASDRVEKRLRRVEASLHPDAVKRDEGPAPTAAETLVLADESMRSVVELAERAGMLEETVLIEGETGTGKELIAKLVHESGARVSRPFVALNCAAIPENMLE